MKMNLQRHFNNEDIFYIFFHFLYTYFELLVIIQKQTQYYSFILLLKGTVCLNSTASEQGSQIKLAFDSKSFHYCGSKF